MQYHLICNQSISLHIPLFPFSLWRTVMIPLYGTETLCEQHNDREDGTSSITKWPHTNCSIVQKSLKAKRWHPIWNGKYSLPNGSCTSQILFLSATFGCGDEDMRRRTNELNVRPFSSLLQNMPHRWDTEQEAGGFLLALNERSVQTHTHKHDWTHKTFTPKRPELDEKKRWKSQNASNPLSGCRVNLLGVRVHFCMFLCICWKDSEWGRGLCPAAPLWPITAGNRFWIIRHIHYSTAREYQRERRESKMQTAGRPATTTHHIYQTIC